MPQPNQANLMPQHQQPRDRDPQPPPPTGPNGPPGMPNPSDPPHLLHPMPGLLDRPQPPRYMDNPSAGPFNFRHSPGDLTRPHAAFSPAGFPPRGTPTSLPSGLPGFPQGANGFPSIPGMPALESILMQYHLHSLATNNIREQEERERERERERRDQELRRLASASGGLDQCFDLQRRLFAGQHPGYPGAPGGAAGPGGNLPPPMLNHPGSPNPAGLAGMMGFPPTGDDRDLFNERMSQSDALFRLQMGQCSDLSSAQAALAALGHFHPGGPPEGGPGGPGGLGMPPPPHSQAEGVNPLAFPGPPGARPMLPGRDHFFNPQRYAPYGATGPYGAPSPFFGLGGPHAP